MSTLNRDYDDVLRRALHAAAESVEPSPDGLERIRARMSTPSAPSFTSAVAWCREAVRAIAMWAAPLSRMVVDAFWSAIDRFRPASAAPGESGRRYGWIRPVAATGTAIFVVAAGAFAIMTLPHAISANGGSGFSFPWADPAAPGGGSGGGGGNGGLNGDSSSQISGGVSGSVSTGYSSAPSPAASQCSSLGSSRTGTQAPTPPLQTPSASPSTTTSPPASSTPTTTPTTTPTPSTTPTPTNSTTPNPGSQNTPTPSTSPQPANTPSQTANGSDTTSRHAKDEEIVPTASPSHSSSANPCASSPATKKKKKSSQPTASSDVSAYGSAQFRSTEAAPERD